MNKFRFTIKVLVIAIFMFAFASITQAQASRTWVSGVGDDANPCSRTAPCKTWAGAISKTAPCGEIDALDPGGFGAVTITKSITLDGTGTMASILASLTTGIIINAAATDVITIRGISINGFCNGIRGINVIQAKTVNIEDCVIFRFANEGILVNETSSTELNLNVRESVIRDNAGEGISLTSSTGQVKAALDHVRVSGNGSNGVRALAGARVVANNCVFSHNAANGVLADAVGAGTIAHVRVWRSELSVNAQGVGAGKGGNAGTSLVELGQNQINNNTAFGVNLSTGGVVETFSNNSIRGNGTDGCAGCTAVGPGN
jgi:Right handed beta helix region